MLFNPPKVLTIAGSDSGGGAGIEADLKTFAALGVHGLVALTTVTAQNTSAVIGVQEITLEMIRLQIEAVVQDIGVDVAKTGMLSSASIIEEVAAAAKRYRFRLVVDPVMVSKSGASLLRPDAVETLKQKLLPLAEVVTPNLDEAERLSGLTIRSLEDSRHAAEEILKFGPKAVVVKGGHLVGNPTDLLCVKGKSPVEFTGPRLGSVTTHGTGCTFSAALASFMALGMNLDDSVRRSKQFVAGAIRYGLRIGRGAGPVDPLANLRLDAERFRVIEKVKNALAKIESSGNLHLLFPECQINIVMALPPPFVGGPDDVCGVPGRIHNLSGRLKASSCPTFGASRHVAAGVLTAMENDPLIRSSMNVRFSDEIIVACRELGFSVGSYDRKEEPEALKKREGSTIPWGICKVIKDLGFVPDIIYHTGDWGKEPMVSIFGRDPLEVVTKAEAIATCIAQKS
jgi:hydroxymethylpyrimidine/phosphomethylpyrimidine kinase